MCSLCILCAKHVRHVSCQGILMTFCHAPQLTELKALLGCVGETRFVMGCISQLQDGRYFLEDLSDALPIDLSEAQTTSGFFTGGCSFQQLDVLCILKVAPTACILRLPDVDGSTSDADGQTTVLTERHADMPANASGEEWPSLTIGGTQKVPCLPRRELHSCSGRRTAAQRRLQGAGAGVPAGGAAGGLKSRCQGERYHLLCG